ncbi:MAG: ABC transporter permease [Clostridia bacterium]|nr:ABC transporter permease [Clostridia bacterium]
MEDNKITNEEVLDTLTTEETADTKDTSAPLDKNVKLLSPTQMVLRRFFRSKLSIIGLVMIVGLFLFSFVGPLFVADLGTKNEMGAIVYDPNDGKWGETELDTSGVIEYTTEEYTVIDENGNEIVIRQTVERKLKDNFRAPPSADHILGTDNEGYDIFVRLMYGGRISLTVSFIAVFVITLLGVVLGGVAGYFGGVIDNVIMRVCDVLMCLPGIPILLIISLILDSANIDAKYRIYLLMIYLTLFSWTGTARLVRGQILSLREQEYMVAAEAMGYSIPRKIFKHLVPNVMPQLIVQMTLSLGSMILYEATLSYLNLGVKAPFAAWGTMINIISTNPEILQNHFNIWGPAGICIVIAVLGFNFVGDGLRDALDPKMRR